MAFATQLTTDTDEERFAEPLYADAIVAFLPVVVRRRGIESTSHFFLSFPGRCRPLFFALR